MVRPQTHQPRRAPCTPVTMGCWTKEALYFALILDFQQRPTLRRRLPIRLSSAAVEQVVIALGKAALSKTHFRRFPPDPKPNLKVEKAVKSSAEVSPGDDVVYHLIVTNTGHGDATNIVLQDALDSDLLYSKSSGIVPSQAPQVGSSGLVSWSIPSLEANGGKVELSLTVTVSDSAPAGSITNIATATVGTDNAPSQPAVINVNRVPKMRLGKNN